MYRRKTHTRPINAFTALAADAFSIPFPRRLMRNAVEERNHKDWLTEQFTDLSYIAAGGFAGLILLAGALSL